MAQASETVGLPGPAGFPEMHEDDFPAAQWRAAASLFDRRIRLIPPVGPGAGIAFDFFEPQ